MRPSNVVGNAPTVAASFAMAPASSVTLVMREPARSDASNVDEKPEGMMSAFDGVAAS